MSSMIRACPRQLKRIFNRLARVLGRKVDQPAGMTVAEAKLKLARAQGIPHCGVIVRKVDVRRHRYLRDHRLPHSPTLAAVFIGGKEGELR